MWRASARGCTVIPGAPASMHARTASITDGIRPPRELRTVATLLTLTDSLRGWTFAAYPGAFTTTSAISFAQPRISASSFPSSMIRSSGSVPE